MKQLVFIIVFMSSVAFGAEPTTITFKFSDGARETFSLFSQEVVALKTIDFFKDMFSSAVTDTEPVELKMTRNTFATIIDLVSTRINGELLFASKQISETAQQKIQDKLARLRTDELIHLILGAHYLDIPNLAELGIQALVSSPEHLTTFLTDTMALQPLSTNNDIANQVISILGSTRSPLIESIYENAQVPWFALPTKSTKQPITRLALNDAGTLLGVTVARDSHMIFDVKTRKALASISVPGGISIDFSPDNKTFMITSIQGPTKTSYVYSLDNFTLLSKITHESRRSKAFYNSDSNIVTISYKEAVCWNPFSQTKIWSTFEPYTSDEVAVGDVGRSVFIIHDYNNNTVNACNMQTGKLLHRFDIQAQIKQTVLSPDEKVLAVGTQDWIAVYDLANGRTLQKIYHKHTAEYFIKYVSNEVMVINRNNDNIIDVWNIPSGTRMHQYPDPKGKNKFLGAPSIINSDGTLMTFYHISNSSIGIFDLSYGIKKNLFTVETYPYFIGSNHGATVFAADNQTNLIYLWSIDGLVKALSRLKQLPLTPLMTVYALMKIKNLPNLSDDAFSTIKRQLALVDTTIQDMVYKRFPQLQLSEQSSGEEIQQIQPAQQEEPSQLGRLIQWLMRKENT